MPRFVPAPPLAVSALLLSACVFGARGEREFSQDWSLAEVETLRISLPDTPLPVTGCDPAAAGCGRLEVNGFWLSVAGTKSDAKSYTEDGYLDLQDDGGFALLTAVKALDVQDLLDLEIASIDMPSDRDLEIATGLGDVDVVGMERAVSVETEVGDVTLDVGAGNVMVRTDYGIIDVTSGGIADLHASNGGIDLIQDGDARDAYVYSHNGNVYIEVASDANLDLQVQAPGRIDVHTDQINTVTSGSLFRETGNGTVKMFVITEFGSVAIRTFGDSSP